MDRDRAGLLVTALSDFELATAVEQVGECTFQGVIPDGWQQGRGAFGGLVLGMLFRAILRCEPDAQRAARTVAGDISGPALPGPAEIRVRALRRGSNQSNFSAELIQGGTVLAIATAVLSKARRSSRELTRATPPPPDDWRNAPVLPVAPPVGPKFAQHYEYRLAGPWPFAGHPVPEVGGLDPRAVGARTAGFARADWPARRLVSYAVHHRVAAAALRYRAVHRGAIDRSRFARSGASAPLPG